MTLPDWFNDLGNRKKINQRSKEQEERVAKELGGKRQPGSGSSEFAPQDVLSDEFMVQVKYTDSMTFRLKVLEWQRLSEDAYRHGREPIMIVEFPLHKIKLMIREIDG